MEPEFKTPTKVDIKIKLTPTTKQTVCILCGERNPKEKSLLVKKGVKSEFYILIERLLHITITEDEHSDIVCRNCQRRLTTIDKHLSQFKAVYEDARNTLKRTHGHKVTKRLASDDVGASSKKALFPDDMTSLSSGTDPESDRYLLLQDDCSIQTRAVDPKYDSLLQALMYSSDSEIEQEILKIPSIVTSVKDSVFKSLEVEVRHLCSVKADSILRYNDKDSLLAFSFKRIEEEWKERAPLFHKFLATVSENPSAEHRNKFKKGEGILHGQVSAGCKLLNLYNREMKALQNINDLILLKGGLKKSAFNRMQSTGVCHSYKSTIDLADKLADKWNEELLIWQDRSKHDSDIEHELIQQAEYLKDTIQLVSSAGATAIDLVMEQVAIENELDKHRKGMHPGYYFVGDNVDMFTKTRQMTVKNQNKDQHMYQICAYLNRVDGNDLDNSCPLQEAATAPFAQLVPGDEEYEKLMDNFSFLTAKRWCKYIPYFAPFACVLPAFIDHPFMKETQTRTRRINMGVLKKNESKNEEMADICKFLHLYVPGHDTDSDSIPLKTLSGGDYLTFERHKQAQMSVRDDETPSLRLEGLVPKMEEFHNQAELLKVIWQCLYSTNSSRDIGTMYAARNVTNSKNVTADPSGNYYASALMADKFIDSYLVAGALDHFDMELNGEPKQDVYVGAVGDMNDMRTYLLQQARKFVENKVEFQVRPLPDYGAQSMTLKCRYCAKEYKQGLRLRKHESREHNHRDPLYSNDWVPDVEQSDTTDSDMVLNYTKLSLFLGLLRLNHNDAIAMGDGERIMLVNQYLYLLYKQNNCPKYAFGILETVCQSKILLTPRLAHRLKWNRTVNHRGKKDTNHPNDLDLEHCNRIFKDEAHSFRGTFTEKTISRVSRSALSTYNIVKNYDKQTNVHEASGLHTDADLSADIELIVNQLIQSNVFKRVPGRRHGAFQTISPNPFAELDMEQIRDWIAGSLRKYSAKHFY